MANVLNNIITSKPINNPSMQAKPAYTIDTTGKIKPLEDKAKLLPSRIFGSPIEYAKDIKKDVLNIGKAVKGKANDHELGRINDLAMKVGAGALAAYLFVKNPFKLGKAMEIIGAGSFFASMALWPKLAIQAPLKARTGVDIHQKYIDSQGRKKMLHQDPQYDLTDLYSRQDLDKMGKKLKVDENLPDRDRFIKQRAKKTAVQGNTLWMMTAGLATPLASAMMCNVLEEPVSKGIEKANLLLTKNLLDNEKLKQSLADQTSKRDIAFISKFCKDHAGKTLSEDMINQLSKRMTKGLPEEITTALKQEIKKIGTPEVTADTIDTILKGCGVGEDVITHILKTDKENFIPTIVSGNKRDMIKFAKFIKENGGNSTNLNEILQTIKQSSVSVDKIEEPLKELGGILGEARTKGGFISRFIQERVGDQQNSHIANQWGRATKKFIKSLGLSDKEIKELAKGDFSKFEEKLSALANNNTKFGDFEKNFLGMIDEYDKVTGEKFLETITTETHSLFSETGTKLKNANFETFANAFNKTEKGSAAHNLISRAADRAKGAKSSFFRMFQAVDARKGDVLKNSLKASGIADDRIEQLVEVCKNVSLNATTTDFVEKLKSCGFELTNNEFKAVSKALFEKADDTDVRKGFTQYCKEFIGKVINADNGIVTENARCHLGGTTKPMYEEMNTLVGSTIKKTIQDTAKNITNSRKWLKISGIGLAVVTAATLIATLAIGRKGKTEKQVEESNKVNG